MYGRACQKDYQPSIVSDVVLATFCCLFGTRSLLRLDSLQDWGVFKQRQVISNGAGWVSGYISSRCPGSDPTKLLALQVTKGYLVSPLNWEQLSPQAVGCSGSPGLPAK